MDDQSIVDVDEECGLVVVREVQKVYPLEFGRGSHVSLKLVTVTDASIVH